jgi:uncharacterized protein (DUF736 family)
MTRADALKRTSNPNHRRFSMAQIGQFTREKTRFVGRIHTLTLYRDLTIVPAEPSDAENAPDYRIHHGDENGPEVGAGWKRAGEKAGEYISLQFDDPSFVQPIRANLFQSAADEAAWSLHWNRPPKRGERD